MYTAILALLRTGGVNPHALHCWTQFCEGRLAAKLFARPSRFWKQHGFVTEMVTWSSELKEGFSVALDHIDITGPRNEGFC